MKFKKGILLVIALGSLAFAVSCSQPKDDSDKNVSGSINLASLSVSPGELVPKFDKDTTQYTVTVPNSVTSITVKAEPEDKYAAILTVPGTTIELDVGLNDIVVSVIVDGYDYSNHDPDPSQIKRYYINVTRLAQ